jgi:hypothetical protein
LQRELTAVERQVENAAKRFLELEKDASPAPVTMELRPEMLKLD